MQKNTLLPELDLLRDELLRDLSLLQKDIEENLGKVENKHIRHLLLKIIERQDRLFSYYVENREEAIRAIAHAHKSKQNSFTESLDLLAKLF